MGKNLTTIVVGVIALSAITLAAILGVVLTAPDQETTPLITAIIAFTAPTLLGIFALAKIDSVHKDVTATKEHIENGLIKDNVKAALDELPAQHPLGGAK